MDPYQNPQVWSGSAQRWRPHVVVKYNVGVTFFFFFFFLIFFNFLQKGTGHTERPILMPVPTKHVVPRKEVPFGGQNNLG